MTTAMTKDEVRFWTKVLKGEPTQCWEWQAGKDKGYGVFYAAGRLWRAHRVSYELIKGAVPKGLELDHLCRNPSCVNPAHLEAVTCSVNTLRGLKGRLGKTHCPQGHPYDEKNSYFRASRPSRRECRICHNAQSNQSYHRRQGTGGEEMPHICTVKMLCRCSILALEPNPHCPVHGHPYPPRCGCGKFVTQRTQKQSQEQAS